MASTDKLSFIVTAGKSNAEGLLGSKATAEGYLTTASGRAAHAEGSDTTASGEYFPHAEGSGTTASGNYSHAEGCNTKASGESSHAEGGNTSSAGSVLGDVTIDSSDIPNLPEAITVKGPVAYGTQSHAEGAQTLAYGCDSHAEGYRTIASGNYSHAEGYRTKASGNYSHAEGYDTTASGNYSHAEGNNTTASGNYSHAEGYDTTASVSYSHAEGYTTTASGYYSHAEGNNTTASGYYSHAEGNNTTASGNHSHAEGNYTTASGNYGSHAEGYRTTASGISSHAEGGNASSTGSALIDVTIDSSDIPDLGAETINVEGPVAYGIQSHAEGTQTLAYGYSSHAEGYSTIASENSSHAEGYNTIASGDGSHAEGNYTTASGNHSHAEGNYTTASGNYGSHAEGSYTTASGIGSHAEGNYTTASGIYSHAEGYYTTARSYQHAGGRYNSSTTGPTSASSTAGSIFVLGKGTSSTARSNAFRITTTGAVYGNGAYNTSGADYAEYFEWKDKNMDNQDRVGLFVTLDGEHIRIANSDDDYILGVVSATPSVIGDSYFGDNWHGMYETDIFGRPIIETVHVEEYIDEETGEIVPTHDEDRWVLNPDWNYEQEYKSREDRSEWSAIGMLGKLIVIDDGTCEVNRYCKVADNGIATKSDDKSGYRVMVRLDDTHIKILFR